MNEHEPGATTERASGSINGVTHAAAGPWATAEPAERPLSLRPRPADVVESPSGPTVIDRGERIFIDTWDEAERAPAPAPATTAKSRRARIGFLREMVETAILAVVIFLAVRAVVQNFRVEGQSMDPTYATGQYVLVNKALYQQVSLKPLARVLPFIDWDTSAHYVFHAPQRGEVIVFHPPLPEIPNQGERDFIKRVIGVPGDHVVVKDGRVSVNGQDLQEPYLHGIQTFCGGQWCDITLGPGKYFVMGDNRSNSSDSRLWGPVDGDKVIGKAMFVYLPFSDFGPAPTGGTTLAPAAAAPSPQSRTSR